MDEPMIEQQEVPMPAPLGSVPLRTYYGDERRGLFASVYDGVERRIPDPPTEQDAYRDAEPN